MRLHDTLTGLLTIGFGVAVIAAAWNFPRTPGQDIGPGLFPLLIGAGLAICGVLLMRSGWRRRDQRWFELDAGLRRPRNAVSAALVIAGLVFYALAVETLGFFVTAFVILVALFAAFGVRGRWIAPIAVGATLALHFAFYTLLRVPLPWGWLEGVAW